MHFKQLILCLTLLFSLSALSNETIITVGSKRFTENYILGEIMSQYLESNDFKVERKFGLGGTLIAFQALFSNEIDVYPEYTGTLSEAVFKKKNQSLEQLRTLSKEKNVEILKPFGFNNTYAIVMRTPHAQKLKIKNISDLSLHPKLQGAFSGEFQQRNDGWVSLKKMYKLQNKIRSIEVPLTYEALKNKKVDFVEAYSTEPLILKNNLKLLYDDKNFFPTYAAVPIVHKQLPQKAKNLLNKLHNSIDTDSMTKMNQLATQGVSFSQIAQEFLISKKLVIKKSILKNNSSFNVEKLIQRTKDHLFLTCLAVLFATLIAVPIASFISNKPRLAQPVLTFSGLLQTIPSIALLTFMIPFVGIGFKPALLGLFVYSLLPIIRNTYTAMNSIDPRIITSARGIGLYPLEIFCSIKLPLSLPMILAGIRTATILNIGTATLAAFIGAGGLGEPIVTGLALNDTSIILEGAVPAALLAIVIDFLFGKLEKTFNKSL